MLASLILCAALGAQGPEVDDADLHAAWSRMTPEQRSDVVQRFQAEVEWLGTFQLELVDHVLAGDEVPDPGMVDAARPVEWFDPEKHAPAQPIRRTWLSPTSKKAERVLAKLEKGIPPRKLRPAFEYDWARRKVVRVADFRDPDHVFHNALAGFPPKLDFAEAVVLAAMDDGSFAAEYAAFGHAYTDRAGNAYPGVTLYDAWASGMEMEMPDVDTLGIVHDLTDEWNKWKAPVSRQKSLYARVGELFVPAHRHRGLRTALARCYLIGTPVMRDGYGYHLHRLHALWNANDADVQKLVAKLPSVDEWEDFLVEWTIEVEETIELRDGGYVRQRELDADAAKVRDLLVRILRDTGALEASAPRDE